MIKLPCDFIEIEALFSLNDIKKQFFNKTSHSILEHTKQANSATKLESGCLWVASATTSAGSHTAAQLSQILTGVCTAYIKSTHGV